MHSYYISKTFNKRRNGFYIRDGFVKLLLYIYKISFFSWYIRVNTLKPYTLKVNPYRKQILCIKAYKSRSRRYIKCIVWEKLFIFEELLFIIFFTAIKLIWWFIFKRNKIFLFYQKFLNIILSIISKYFKIIGK